MHTYGEAALPRGGSHPDISPCGNASTIFSYCCLFSLPPILLHDFCEVDDDIRGATRVSPCFLGAPIVAHSPPLPFRDVFLGRRRSKSLNGVSMFMLVIIDSSQTKKDGNCMPGVLNIF